MRVGRGDRVLVFRNRSNVAQQWCRAFGRAAAESGIDVATVAATGRTQHPWFAAHDSDGVRLVLALGDVVTAAEAAAEHAVPVLAIQTTDDPEHVTTRLDRVLVRSETLLRVQPARRSRRLVLAECVVVPGRVGDSIRVRGDGGLDAVVPFVRIVNRDPFGLLDERRCVHQSAYRLGLCWSDAEPLADRMVNRRSRLDVSSISGASMQIDGDDGRFRALASQLTVGPSRELRVASIITAS